VRTRWIMHVVSECLCLALNLDYLILISLPLTLWYYDMCFRRKYLFFIFLDQVLCPPPFLYFYFIFYLFLECCRWFSIFGVYLLYMKEKKIQLNFFHICTILNLHFSSL
jgi:hypothetical protein